MDRAALIDRLAEGHAVALRLHDAHEPDTVIATALGIPAASVPTLLTVAEAKLAALTASAAEEGLATEVQ